MAGKSKVDERDKIETEPDAWERFERAVDTVTKRGPKPKPAPRPKKDD